MDYVIYKVSKSQDIGGNMSVKRNEGKRKVEFVKVYETKGGE